MDELRSGGSYFSQNDLRMHFGLDQATKVDLVEIRWLSGQVDQLKDLDVNQSVCDRGGRQDSEIGSTQAGREGFDVGESRGVADSCGGGLSGGGALRVAESGDGGGCAGRCGYGDDYEVEL